MGYESVSVADESAAGAPPLDPGEASSRDPGEASSRDPGEASPRDPGEASSRDPGEASPRDPGATAADSGTRSEFWNVGVEAPGGMEQEHA